MLSKKLSQGKRVNAAYKFLRTLTNPDDAVFKVSSAINVILETVERDTLSSLGYVSAEDVVSTKDFPPYNRSAVDGFAVKAEDTSGSSITNPVVLKIKGFMHTSDSPEKYMIEHGECVEVTTGAPLPIGADAVVMAEHTRKVSEGEVEILKPVAIWDNVSLKGEDVKKGQVIVRRGEIIRPWHIGLLATLNIAKIRVYRKPVASVLGVGDELVPLGSEVKPGRIVSSTMYLVKAFLEELGVNVPYIEIVPDNPQVIRDKVAFYLSRADFIFTTGGTSVGLKDFTVEAVKSLDPEVFIHGVAIKPGKPIAVAVIKGKPVFMLSGYPVATYTELLAIFEPIYYRLYGSRSPPKPKVKGKLIRRVYVEPGVRGYVRVKVFRRNGEVLVEPLITTGSGILSTLIVGNGILIVPEELEGYDEGETVEVILTNPIIEEA